jgi:hypothetical protein
MRWHRKRYGIYINGRSLTNLRFADDIAMFAHTARGLQEMLRELDTKNKKVGLTMNPTKTKIMTNHTEIPFTIEGTKIEYCKGYPYLNHNINMAGEGEKETHRRIRHAWGAFWNLKFILLNKRINLKARFETLEYWVIPVLLYGSQTWTMTEGQIKKIQVCQHKTERKVLDIKLWDKVRNEDLRRESGIEDAVSKARTLKWRWGEHVARMTQERWAHATTRDPRQGKRRGRPRHRWSQEFKNEVGAQWTRLARDRAK